MAIRSSQRTICVILGGGRGTRLYPLTKMRAKPAVPLGGKYRLIDVPISNCLNSGLNQIYVVTQFEGTSLLDHLKEAYRFDRFGNGFVETLAAQQRYDSNDWYQGTADAVRQNLEHFGGDWEEMLILSGDQLYRMDFRALLENHRTKKADATIAVLPVVAEEAPSLGILGVDKSGRITRFREKPPLDQLEGLETADELFQFFRIEAKGRPYMASMGIYVFNRNVIFEELATNQYIDFGKNLLPAMLEKYNLQAFLFDGYWEDIGTVKAFHQANLALAKLDAPFTFASEQGLIYTRSRTLPSTIAERIQATDSIVADGVRIGDAVLENSVVGLRSIIGKNVRLIRSMVMGADYYEFDVEIAENARLGRPNVGIGDNVVIENTIVDKNVRIGSDVVLRPPAGSEPKETPVYVVQDGVLCIVKGAVIPSGTRIGCQ